MLNKTGTMQSTSSRNTPHSQGSASGPSPHINPQLALKLDEVRARAELYGQVFTNLPRERYADARFDELFNTSPTRAEHSAASIVGRFSSNPPAVSSNRVRRSRSTSAPTVNFPSESPIPFCENELGCTKCCAPGFMKKIFIRDFAGNILSHSCSTCGEVVSASPLVQSLAVQYPYAVAHECEVCGWRVCLRCNIMSHVQRDMASSVENKVREVEERFKSETALLEKEILELSTTGVSTDGGDTADLIASFKQRLAEVESRLSAERKSKDQVSSLLASLQKEYMQYKTDVEMNMESNAAEQVLLQSRLVEQSVLLADARARIDEITSVQRLETPTKDAKTPKGFLSQREAILFNENNHLKEEVDALKVSMHMEFDSWKRTVMAQVKEECGKYKNRLKRSLRMDNEAVAEEIDSELINVKELDFLFDEVDWTCGTDELKQSPERMKEYIESNTPEKRRSPLFTDYSAIGS